MLYVQRLDPRAQLPVKAHGNEDLGYDLCALEDMWVTVGTVVKVRTGIACRFPEGYGALIRDRSSVATKRAYFVVAGVVDEGYSGEILVALYIAPVDNDTGAKEFINAGEKIAQMILVQNITMTVQEVNSLDHDTIRGERGFGSTGR